MVITNKDEKAFDFQVLLHTYLRVKVRFLASLSSPLLFCAGSLPWLAFSLCLVGRRDIWGSWEG